MMSETIFFEFCLQIFLGFLATAIVLVFLSLVQGPKLEDRVVAIDLFSSIVLSSIAFYAIYSNHASYLSAAMVLALFGFLGTVIFARFIEKEHGANS